MELKEIMEQIVIDATASVTSFLQVGSGGSFTFETGHMVYCQLSINYLASIMTSLPRFSFTTMAEIEGYNSSKEGNLLICLLFYIDMLETRSVGRGNIKPSCRCFTLLQISLIISDLSSS